MKKQNIKNLCSTIICLELFVLWTFLLLKVNLAPIGPNGSVVGFSAFNKWFHNLTGVHMWLYTVTDWLGLVPVAICFGFAVLGFVQLIKRKNILKVDYSILILGLFYIATITVYLFFESVVINYRPVLISGFLEASYPSSTTLLVLCVMPTAVMQLRDRIKNEKLRKCVLLIIKVFIVYMVVGRLLSGVHWATDIIGGVLLSGGLVNSYRFVCGLR